MTTHGRFHAHAARTSASPAPRTSVIFGGDVPRDLSVPLAQPTDLIEVDRRIGYVGVVVVGR